MSVTPYIYDGGLLTATAANQGSQPAALTKRVIKAATVTNTTAAPVAVTVHLVPPGGTAGPANTMISARAIDAGASYPCPELINQGIPAGGSVQALGLGLTFKYTAVDFV